MSTVQSLTPVWLCDPMDILQHARLPCPSPTPGSCSNTCPLSHWCHPTISSSVVPFSSRLQSFLTSGSFLMSQFFASGGQSRPKYWSFSFNINPSNEYSGLISFRIDWVNLLIVQRTLKSLLQHHSLKVRFFGAQPDCNSAINNDNPVSLEKTLRVFLFHCGFQEAQGQIIS